MNGQPCAIMHAGDQSSCTVCKMVWDRNDMHPPACPISGYKIPPVAMANPTPATAEECHPLYAPLMCAIEQAMRGKGERHGGATTPFLEQQWVALAKSHGIGFLTGQAAKKLNEAAAGKSGEAYERELLGAIVYIGMAILKHRGQA